MWGKNGLCNVFQKEANVFVFKFTSESTLAAALSQGTWYIANRPMVMCEWGRKIGETRITSLPLWVKFTNVPDCYWTREGLSFLASPIGTPICADPLTSKLDMLPFAKMCVQYNVGDPLPNVLKVLVLDPVTNESTTKEVNVSYPSKPKYCDHCKSLGHISGACPLGKHSVSVKDKAKTVADAPPETVKAQNDSTPVKVQLNPDNSAVVGVEEGWSEARTTTTISKESTYSDTSPPVQNVFQGLVNVDEVEIKRSLLDKNLSSSHRKRLKKKLRKGGVVTPSQS
ncbi:hypothetical protein POM88_054161 [Heracleum sosnowskyi]|uniref:DUF4283 domain-containing protein n=1 Tax=Heracleum sosnowskyi TaxID=360622 RepID=A0AAD8LWX0_9APIA|nr:hypothetical protein POM88_054161 [Heracleum sosnowskyi]